MSFASTLKAGRQRGFTLLEVLVALLIVGTALAACLGAVGSLSRNCAALRAVTLATWSAENRLASIRISGEWPNPGSTEFDCSQDLQALSCGQTVSETANPNFRRVTVAVRDAADPSHRLISLSQLVAHAD
jgi:general secretion pathway protein I